MTEYGQLEKQQNKEIAEKKRRQEQNSSTTQPLLKQQTLLQSASSSTKKFEADHPKQVLITEKIALMLCKDLQPYSIVEDEGFRAVLQAAEPRYVIPARKTFSDTIIPNLHKTSIEAVKEEVKSAVGLSITTDAWTSRSNQSYISYTAHFLTQDFSMKNYCLKVEHSDERHTAVNLAKSLSNCIAEWTTQAQREAMLKTVVVSDNAANMQAAIAKIPQVKSLGCFDHTLQLVINDAVKNCPELDQTVHKAKTITTHFKHSSINANKLLELERQMGIKELKLKQECPTRWNSRFDMLERLVTVKDAVCAIIASVKQLPTLSANEWEAAEEYVKIFKPFKILTAQMSSAERPTISMIIPELNKLKHTLSSESIDSTCFPTMREDLLNSIHQRWPDFESKPVFAVATTVDPRYKDCGFDDMDAASAARNFVLTEMESLYSLSRNMADADQSSTDTTDPGKNVTGTMINTNIVTG